MKLPVLNHSIPPGALKECEADDPMSLEGVFIPDGELTTMAEAVVEEYARMGAPEAQILSLFSNPFFSGTHRYYALYGEKRARELIRRTLARTGVYRYRMITTDEGESSGKG